MRYECGMKTLQSTIITLVVGLSLQASAVMAQSNSNRFTEQELIAKVVKAPTGFALFDSTWETRAKDANDALLRLKKLPSLSIESKAVLLSMVRQNGQPSGLNPFPFYEDQSWDEVQKMLRSYAQLGDKYLPAASQAKVIRDQQTIRIIVPICEVLAKHGVKEAVPALINRYKSGEDHWNKDDMFAGLTLFNDPRAIPLMEEYWRKNGNDRDADLDMAIYDIIPTIRDYLEGRTKVEGATPEETIALNDEISARAQALADLLQNSVSIEIESAFDGSVKRRDERKASYMVFTPAGKWKRVELPFDQDLQEKTYTTLDTHNGQIGGLRTDLTTTQGSLTTTQGELKVAQTKIEEHSGSIAGMKTTITTIEGKQAELAQNIEATELRLNAKIDTTNADVAKTKERIENFTQQLGALREALTAELAKQDSKVDDKVKALQTKLDGVDSALKALNQRVKGTDRNENRPQK